MAHSDTVSLHRLLEREAAGSLLEAFGALMPNAAAALIALDGRCFAGRSDWPRAEVAAWLAQAADGHIGQIAGGQLYPLVARSQPLGALALRGSAPDAVIQCLLSSLTLLIDQALATRDVARETLDRYREINLLYRIGETIGASLDPDEIPRLELTEARRVIQAEVSAVLLPAASAAGGLEVKASLGASGHAEALRRAAHDLIEQVRRTGRPDILVRSPVEGVPIESILCTPLKVQERVLGVVLLGRLAGQPVFTAGDEKLALALASQAAIALEKAELHQREIKRQRMEEELAIGRRIQLSLLPEACPIIPGWEFAATYEAAYQVGGDFYDFFEVPDESESHRLGLVIADVTGKGVPAALMMAFSRAIIRTEAMSGHSPSAVLEQANRLIVQDNRSRLLLSAFYAILDPISGRLVYASGGHDRPLWLRAATGECLELRSRSLVLGAFPFVALEERTIEVAPGDRLVFYTDGVTEARTADGQMFGEARLQATAQAHRTASAAQVLQAVVDEVKDFVGGAPAADDFTLLVVKRN